MNCEHEPKTTYTSRKDDSVMFEKYSALRREMEKMGFFGITCWTRNDILDKLEETDGPINICEDCLTDLITILDEKLEDGAIQNGWEVIESML